MKNILKILTFNLKNDSPFTMSTYRWENRYKYIKLILNTLDYDLLGVQELNSKYLEQMNKLLPAYFSIGLPRTSSKSEDELAAIFFSKERFHCIKENTFWLSEFPYKQGSKLKSSIFPRICTLCLLEDHATHSQLLFVNTHLDHLLPYTRQLQIQQLIHVIQTFKEGFDPYILITGDFNTSIHSHALTTLLNSELNVSSIFDDKATNTLHFFNGKQYQNKEPIDHIFYDQRLKLLDYKIISEHFDGHYPSDHFPVYARILIK
ncbi:MAG: endonuclease/exonuclease/phosphatase family protein [Erysipelotrichaceae bacterium]